MRRLQTLHLVDDEQAEAARLVELVGNLRELTPFMFQNQVRLDLVNVSCLAKDMLEGCQIKFLTGHKAANLRQDHIHGRHLQKSGLSSPVRAIYKQQFIFDVQIQVVGDRVLQVRRGLLPRADDQRIMALLDFDHGEFVDIDLWATDLDFGG